MGILCLQLSSSKDLLPRYTDDIPTSPTLISRPIGHAGAHGTAKFHAAEFGGDGEKEGWEDGREGRVLSERRASFACGIKIRVPRYTVVLRSQTRPSGVLSRKDERGAFKRFAEPFFFPVLSSPFLCPRTSRTCVWRGRGRTRAPFNPS